MPSTTTTRTERVIGLQPSMKNDFIVRHVKANEADLRDLLVEGSELLNKLLLTLNKELQDILPAYTADGKTVKPEIMLSAAGGKVSVRFGYEDNPPNASLQIDGGDA